MKKSYYGIQAMDNSGIPAELMEFIKQDTLSLLIKGAAGTGKTTLALTIMRALQVRKNCLYLSSRVSPDQLFEYYSWLEEYFGEPKTRLTDNSEELLTDLPVFVDARLDEPSSLFEKITNNLMDTKTPTVIIDTWDAIGYLMDREALASNARVLETWCRRARAKLILVTEQDSDTTFDSLVDGVIKLEQEYYNGRRIRKILFPKLRGVRINKPSYIFSLNNAIFRSYTQHNPTDFVITSDWRNAGRKVKKSIPKWDSSFITTGYNDLDSLLGGGFPTKCVVNIELDPTVNPKVVIVFLSNVISNFVLNDNTVLFHPFEGLDQDYLERYLRLGLSISPKKDLVKISWGDNKKTYDEITIGQKNSNMEKSLASFQETLLKMRNKNPNKFLLNIMSSDIVERTGQRTEDDIESLITFIRSNADLSVIVSRSSQAAEHISGVSDVYLKIIDVNGTLFLQPEKPWSNLYAVVINKHSGHPSIGLEPLV
ncbi:MAG: KaiC/GvpD/RAD55 family RecA-like ATPase [Candidatus Nitrosomirales archaeon]